MRKRASSVRPRQAGIVPTVSRKIIFEIVGQDAIQVMNYAAIVEGFARSMAETSNALAACSGKPTIAVEVLPVERLQIKMLEASAG